MSGSRHTPGPWRFNSNWDGEAVITTDAGEPVLQQVAPDAMHGGVDALDEDLQLMAAAPELHELLTLIRDADEDCKLDGLPRKMPDFIRARVDAVIARAEGRDP